MPKIDDPKIEQGADEIGRFRAELLSDTGGLTQFGAFVETLWPGGASSKSHWHANEDEMIYVLEGTVTLIERGSACDLQPGEAATFKAGAAVGHHLENRTDAPVRYLVIGTRSGDDVVTYPETGESVVIKDGWKTYHDSSGKVTHRSPYHGA